MLTKEARTALEVGKIFYTGKNVFGYNRLGIGRLIYQLPVEICEMFIDEFFKEETLDSIDDENTRYHPHLLRKQPESFRNLQTALRTPKYTGVPLRKAAEKIRAGYPNL